MKKILTLVCAVLTVAISFASVKENFDYPIRHGGLYQLENNWIVSLNEGNFADNQPGSNDFVRGMAVKDGIMYFIDRQNMSIVRIDGETGEKLDPINLQGTDTLFMHQNEYGIWEKGNVFGYNDLQFDNAGNCLIGGVTQSQAQCQYYYIYIVNLETGVCTKLIEEQICPDSHGYRFDAFGVYGDVRKEAVIMSADANGSWDVYRWLVFNGQANKGENIPCILTPSQDESLFINTPGWGAGARVQPLNSVGGLFYVDGFNTLPMLWQGEPMTGGYLVDDFINTPTGLRVWNNPGDTITMKTGFNGVVDFHLGAEHFLLMAATRNVDEVPTTFALYKFNDDNHSFAEMEPLWYFPHKGLGSATNGSRFSTPAVEIINDSTAMIYIYTVNNGYASYKLTVPYVPSSTVTAQPNDNNRGTVTGSGKYPDGTTVELKAIPTHGYYFKQWNDGITNNPRSITVTQDTTLVAEFEANHYYLNVVTSNSERGTVSGSATVEYMAYAEIAAHAKEGYCFATWNDGNSENPRTVQVTDNVTYTAFFVKSTADSETVTNDTVITSTTDTSVTIVWPTDENADTYTIVIKQGDEVICVLTFDSEGRLLNIAFAPSINRQNRATYAQQTNNGLSFTVTNLNSDTQYNYGITTKDADENEIGTYSGEFTTKSNAPAGVDDVLTPESEHRKFILNGQLLILRDGKTYNVMGMEIK